jgi:hypothetical protein
MAPKSKKATPRNRKGFLPGEHRKRSVVAVERVRGENEPQRVTDSDLLMTTDTYIVNTRRIDSDWTFVMELNGIQTRIPAKVMERFIAQREAILTEQRVDRATGRATKRVAEQIETIDMSGI